eukprot:TRINITY_DN9721_c0_g1_i1.p1 TRINITY_DN9721_c0_g1~~TRINITY_DN9721_c0_g1_i1.p1  ORF type:complete len:363 (+),score=31.84 TRINITY_DN9721_c0_g1_i1:49-1137(+)
MRSVTRSYRTIPKLLKRTRNLLKKRKNSLSERLTLKRSISSSSYTENPRILVTGCQGQIGCELVPVLREKYGSNNVIATDIQKPNSSFVGKGPFKYLDVTKLDDIKSAIVSYNIDWVIHLSGVLSAKGERDPNLALSVNNRGTENVLNACYSYKLRVFSPSSIAAFGSSTPLVDTPDFTIMRPETMYGVGKVYGELLGEYYHRKHGLDFRSLRYPGVLSWKVPPGGGTTDYAIDIFHKALTTKTYKCFLSPDARLPMMYMDDCISATVRLMTVDESKLKQRVYNVTAVSWTPSELATAIQKHIPDFKIIYEPDFRDNIAKTWPKSLNDQAARTDWGWKEEYGLDEIVSDMLKNLSKVLNAKK